MQSVLKERRENGKGKSKEESADYVETGQKQIRISKHREIRKRELDID